MQIKTNNFFTQYYLEFYAMHKWALPDNLCTYFWKLCISLLFFPVAIIGMGINKLLKFKDSPSLGTAIITLLLLTLLWLVGAHGCIESKECILDTSLLGMLGYFTKGFLMFVGIMLGCGIIIFIIYSLVKLIQYVFTKTSNKASNSIVVERYKAFKGKHCPKIDWK